MTIRIRTYHNAMAHIETPDLSVIFDPWVDDGIMDGSWGVWPPCSDLEKRVPRADIVCISHLHADHCSPAYLRRYLSKFPYAKIIIAPFKHNWLARKLDSAGLPYKIAARINQGETELALFPVDENENDIDSAAAIRWRNQCVVNMNDCDFVPAHVARIKEFAEDVTCALLPASGAGSWPHTFFDLGEELESHAVAKYDMNLGRHFKFADAFKPRAIIPFAGSYALIGRNHVLNPYRGNVAPTDYRAWEDRNAIIPAPHGDGIFDCGTLQASAECQYAYSTDLARYGLERAWRQYHYEGAMTPSVEHLRNTLYRAAGNRAKYSGVNRDHWYCFQLDGDWLALNTNRADSAPDLRKEVASLEPRTEIYIDPRHLIGLLTGIYNWGVAEGGSHYMSRRYGIGYEREVNDWLLGLHV